MLVDAATATALELPSSSETAQTLATLQEDFNRFKNEISLHKEMASNLSKRCDAAYSALEEPVWRLFHKDMPHVAAKVAALQADFKAVHARTAEAFSNQDTALSNVV